MVVSRRDPDLDEVGPLAGLATVANDIRSLLRTFRLCLFLQELLLGHGVVLGLTRRRLTGFHDLHLASHPRVDVAEVRVGSGSSVDRDLPVPRWRTVRVAGRGARDLQVVPTGVVAV